MVSQCPDIAPILDFAEELDDTPLSFEGVRTESNSHRWMPELNIGKLGGRLWGFLNTASLDKAHDYFEFAGELNGSGGCGRIAHQTRQGANARQGILRRIVKNVP